MIDSITLITLSWFPVWSAKATFSWVLDVEKKYKYLQFIPHFPLFSDLKSKLLGN